MIALIGFVMMALGALSLANIANPLDLGVFGGIAFIILGWALALAGTMKGVK